MVRLIVERAHAFTRHIPIDAHDKAGEHVSMANPEPTLNLVTEAVASIPHGQRATDRKPVPLQTLLSKAASVPAVHNISDPPPGDTDAQLTLSVISGQAPDGNFRTARVDEYRRLMTVTAAEGSPLHGSSVGAAEINGTNEQYLVSPAYAEQTTGARRSFVSTSAEDSAGGTGLRTVEIEYYRADLTGPFFETITLNGLTPVPTVAADICFIERIIGRTVGSSGFAVGDVQLKASDDGTGATIWSIAAGQRQTFGGHHYCAPDAHVHISGLIAGVTSAQAASIYVVFVETLTPNACPRQISPIARVTNDGQAQIVLTSREGVRGPGKLVVAIKRDSASGTHLFYGTVEYYHNADI